LLNARLLTSAFTNQPVPKPPTAVAPTMANTRTTNVPTSSIASNEKWPKLILNLRLLVFLENLLASAKRYISIVAFMDFDKEYHTRGPHLETSGHTPPAVPEEETREIH